MKILGYEIHPACLAMPEMSDEEYRALRADIEYAGQLCPIETHKGKVLDGRHRLRACKDLCLDPWVAEADVGDLLPTAYVVSLNFARRHLTASQKAAIAAELLPELAAEAKQRQKTSTGGSDPQLTEKIPEAGKGESREKAAEAVGVNERYVSDAKKLKEESPEAFEQVKSGKKSLAEAKRETKAAKISGGTSFDVPEIEAAKPRRKKQGAPSISTAGRKAASVALGKLIRALDAVGLYEEFEPSLSQIDERLRNA